MQVDKKLIWGLVKKSYANAARDDGIKDRLAYRDISFNWNIEDIHFCFSVTMNEGKVLVKEGEIKNPDVVFYSKKAEDFHRGNIEEMSSRDMLDHDGFRWVGKVKHLRHISALCKSMRFYYKGFAAGM